MLASSQNPPPIKLLAVTVPHVALLALLTHLVSIHLLFGTSQGLLVSFLVFPVTAVALTVLGVNFFLRDVSVPQKVTARAIGFVVTFLCFFAMALSPPTQGSLLAVYTKDQVKRAAVLLDRPPPVAAELTERTKNAKAVRENRDFLLQVAKSTTSPEAITNYLSVAQQMGVDTSFVAANAMLRPQDTEVLFRRAMELAADGNRDAVAFMQQYQHLAWLQL